MFTIIPENDEDFFLYVHPSSLIPEKGALPGNSCWPLRFEDGKCFTKEFGAQGESRGVHKSCASVVLEICHVLDHVQSQPLYCCFRVFVWRLLCTDGSNDCFALKISRSWSTTGPRMWPHHALQIATARLEDVDEEDREVQFWFHIHWASTARFSTVEHRRFPGAMVEICWSSSTAIFCDQVEFASRVALKDLVTSKKICRWNQILKYYDCEDELPKEGPMLAVILGAAIDQ